MSKKALVLSSGGVDSTTCVGLAVKELGKDNVITASLYYGQKHDKELECARKIAEYYGVKHIEEDISNVMKYANEVCTLIKGGKDIIHKSYAEQIEENGEGRVPTYVPFRNGLFFGKGTVTGLYASGHARAQISLKNGKFVLGAFGKFSLLNATGQIGIGNDDFSVSLVGVGDIGTVSAMAGILINPSKNTYFAGIAAKAAVFTARGGVQFEIFDTQIEVGGSVSALSAGFQFGVGIKDGEFYYKSGFAVLFEYDFYIRIKFA